MWLYADISTVSDIARHHGRATPDKLALVDDQHRMTFGELDHVSSKFARRLVNDGVCEGDVVAFFGKNSIPYFLTMFAASKAGATLLPLNWRLTPVELSAIVDDAKPARVFVDQEFVPHLQATLDRCAHRVEFQVVQPTASPTGDLENYFGDSPADDPGLPSDPRATAWLMYTSGTTGVGKGVEISHHALNLMRLSEHLEPALQWKPEDSLMMVMPNFHLLGTALPIQALYNGCGVSMMPALEPGRLLALLGTTRPTILVVAPTVIQMMLDHPNASGADFNSLRLIMYAGSAINAQLLKRALKDIGCDFMQFYGTTECVGPMCILRPDQHDLVNERRLKSCGTPMPLVDFKVLDEQGRELPDGEKGELVIRTPAMFTRYRNQPELTAQVLQRGWYHTGDAGYRDPADGLLYIVDRVKDMIVTGGENVYSAEVEQVVHQHPAVSMAAVIALPDSKWGERVTAVVVRRAGAPLTEQELIAHCRTMLAGYKVPKQVIFADSLPVSPAGKVLKRLLRETHWAGQDRAVA
jgi:acyl-CoA synthetase (AMP-forming)/AMP-acid ligase II